MYRVSLIGDQNPFADVQAFAQRYPELVLDLAQQRLQPRGDRLVQQRLIDTEPPERQGKKVRWTSEKQRRAYFATDGFGHGIPYKRTHKLAQSWRFVIVADKNGLTISVINDAPAAPFVQGKWQQGFHADQGWLLARPVIDTIATDLQPVIETIPRDVFATVERR